MFRADFVICRAFDNEMIFIFNFIKGAMGTYPFLSGYILVMVAPSFDPEFVAATNNFCYHLAIFERQIGVGFNSENLFHF